MLLRRRRAHQVVASTVDNRPSCNVPPTAESASDEANLDMALNVALGAAVQGTGADAAAIGLIRGKHMVCRARVGDIAPNLGAVLNVDTGITGACVRSGEILHCEDAETDRRVDSTVCRAMGIQSILVVPIVVGGSVIGILVTLASTAHAFDAGHIRWLTVVANFVRTNAHATDARVSQTHQSDAKALSSSATAREVVVENSSPSDASPEPEGRDPAEEPGLTSVRRVLQNSSATASWDEICEQLALGFK